MSYFAILSDDAGHVQVERCHINLWSLSGLFGRRIFYLDVGLALMANAAPKSLSLVLPVAVEGGDFLDLRDATVKDAKLIFGEPANVVDNVLNWSESPLTLSALRAERKDSGERYSVWTLDPINWNFSGLTYIRGRFRLPSRNRFWTPQRSGAIVDLRLCDVRESSSEERLGGLDARIVPIKKLNLFAIVPALLKFRSASPAPAHVRMLEGEAWGHYLGRRRSRLTHHKWTVYYWKGEDVAAAKPFRAFLDLSEERAVLGWQPYVFFLIVALCCWFLRNINIEQLEGVLNYWVKGLVALVVAIGAKLLFGCVVAILKNVGKVRAVVRALESWWFSI